MTSFGINELFVELSKGCIVHGRASDEMDGGDCPECFEAETDAYFAAVRMANHRHSENGYRYAHDHHGFASEGELAAHMFVRHPE